jgi:4-amino-4-deoxy-L-arabinose transferase-like glycosyltransferase
MTRLSLIAILAAATLLVAWNIGREGTSNIYYAAAVRSMLQDPVTFLFAGFDSGRYVTIDKPPLGHQLQAISALVLGFGGLAVLLPQLVASVLSIWLLYRLLRPAWGAVAALVAALALALTPVSVAVARNTTVDATLVAVLLAGALALQRGLRTGRVRWLALAFALVGIGFELKMLQSYLVLPAFAAAWLVAARGSVARRAGDLLLAAVPLLVVSFAWAVVVALWPVDYRPWIGGSTTNSLLELAVGYNGLARLATGPAYGDTGTAGALRFLEPVLAGQVGWLLPLAGLGVLLGLPAIRGRSPDGDVGDGPDADRLWRARAGSLVLWAGWLATCLVFFSVARFWHRHYLVVMAPAVAALAGIGISLGWRAYRRPGAAGWLLPIVVVVSGLLAAFTLASATELGWLAEPAIAAGLLLGVGMGVVRGAWRLSTRRDADGEQMPSRVAAVLAGLALVIVLVPPAGWSIWTVAGETPIDATLPTGGPPIANVWPGPVDGGGDGDGRFFDPRPNPAVLEYVQTNRGSSTWILAVEGGLEAAPLILQSGLPVMAIGGFQGKDPAIALDGFRLLVREGRVRFAAAGRKASDGAGGGGTASPTASDIVLDWVVATCPRVDGFETLYDCAGRG